MSDDINKLASDLATRYRTGRLVKAAGDGAVHGPALPPGTGGYTPALYRPFPAAPSVDWLTALQNDAGSAWGKLPPALQYALIGGGGLGALGLLSDPGEDAAGRKRSRLTRALRGLLLGGGLGGGLGLMMQAAPGATAGPGTTSPELAKAEAAAAAAEAKRQAILNPPGEQRPTITPKLLGLEATKARATRDAVLPPTAAAPIGPEQISNSQAYAKRYGFPENSIPERLQSSAQLSPEQLDAKMRAWLLQNDATTAEQLQNRDTEQALAGLIGPSGGSVTDGSLYQGALRGAGLGAAAGAGHAVGKNLDSWVALRNPQTIKLKELLDGLRVPTGEKQPAPGRIPGTGKMVDRHATGLEGVRQALAGGVKSETLRTPPPGEPGQPAVMDKRIVTPARQFTPEKWQYLQRMPAQTGKPFMTSTGRLVPRPIAPAQYSKHLAQPEQPATPAVMEDYIKQPERPAKPTMLPRVSEERLFEQLANAPKRPAVGAGATDHLIAQHGGTYAGGGPGLTPGDVRSLAAHQPRFQHKSVVRNTLGGGLGGAVLGAGVGAAMPFVDKKIDTAVNAVKTLPSQLNNWLSLRGAPAASPAQPPQLPPGSRMGAPLPNYAAGAGPQPPTVPPQLSQALGQQPGGSLNPLQQPSDYRSNQRMSQTPATSLINALSAERRALYNEYDYRTRNALSSVRGNVNGFGGGMPIPSLFGNAPINNDAPTVMQPKTLMDSNGPITIPRVTEQLPSWMQQPAGQSFSNSSDKPAGFARYD